MEEKECRFLDLEKTGENLAEIREKSSKMEEQLTLAITLRPSASTNSQKPKEKKLTFSCYPQTGLDIKELIESELQIPVCIQSLSFHCQALESGQRLASYHLRDYDSLTVSYTTSGDVREIADILQLMSLLADILELRKPEILQDGRLSLDTDHVLERLVKPALIESLVCKYFTPVSSEKTKANRLYFVHNGGVAYTVVIHKTLTEIPWDKLTIELQYLEHALLRVIWDLSSTIGVRYLLLQYPLLLQQLSVSILRQKVEPSCKIQVPPIQRASYHAPLMNQLFILGETMFKGMGVIANLAELLQYRESIARCPGLVEQMAAAMLSPSYSIICAEIVISTFLCLSYTKETHPFITSQSILHSIFEACTRFTNEYESNTINHPVKRVDLIIVRYFSTLFCALIGGLSPECFVTEGFSEFLPTALQFMKTFLSEHTYEQLHEAELETTYFWSTYKPFVQLVYMHYHRLTNSALAQKVPLLQPLLLTCLHAGIFSLQNMCLSEDSASILEKEELVDYLTCLPWCVPLELREEARVLVRIVGTKIRPRPPTLQNIVKATLACNDVPLSEAMSPSYISSLI